MPKAGERTAKSPTEMGRKRGQGVGCPFLGVVFVGKRGIRVHFAVTLYYLRRAPHNAAQRPHTLAESTPKRRH